MEREGEFLNQGSYQFLNLCHKTSSEQQGPRTRISCGESDPQQSSSPTPDWVWTHLNRGVCYRRYTQVDLREGEVGKRHLERFKSQAPKKIRKIQPDLGSKRNPKHISPTAATQTLQMVGGLVPKIIFHRSKAISGSSSLPNSALHNPRPS